MKISKKPNGGLPKYQFSIIKLVVGGGEWQKKKKPANTEEP